MEKQSFSNLISLMRRLRGAHGCPWNRAQDFNSLKGYLLEETYEVLSVLNHSDSSSSSKLCEELGDLLLQIVFLSIIAEEKNLFNINNILQGICEKIIRRHPHIFSNEKARTPEEVSRLWEKIKSKEKREASILAGIPKVMPALQRAQQISAKAAANGFDWDNLNGVLDKIEEELKELREVIKDKNNINKNAASHELGDILFTLCNVARHLNISSENALQECSQRFQKRFEYMEKMIKQKNLILNQLNIKDLENLWQEAKKNL